MKMIAVIQDGYARDTQVFTADPRIIEKDPNWENHFSDRKTSCHYVGLFEGESEEEIRTVAASAECVHPATITLIPV